MQSIVPFAFQDKEIRTTNNDGEVFFVLKDILESIDSTRHPSDAANAVIEALGDEDAGTSPIPDSLGRLQNTFIVSEAGATYLLAQARTPAAKELNRFIHKEVLPSIRRYGAYLPNMTETEREYLRVRQNSQALLDVLMKDELTRNTALRAAIEENRELRTALRPATLKELEPIQFAELRRLFKLRSDEELLERMKTANLLSEHHTLTATGHRYALIHSINIFNVAQSLWDKSVIRHMKDWA